MSEQFDQAFWDERYRSQHQLWSGNPNPHLVDVAGDLPAGRALDVGCGEGADAIWLAARGWRVTGIDVSAVALERAAEHAAAVAADADAPATAPGLDAPGLDGRIEWLQADALVWEPPAAAYDLVSAQFLHLPPEARRSLWARLADAVAPGGTLLAVGHHPSDLDTTVRRPRLPELFFTGEDVVGVLDPEAWEIVTDAAPGRDAVDPEGQTVTVHDTVVRARRRRG